jgi:hypothetical protein
MAISAIVIEVLFQALHLIPEQHKARIVETSITWNYTTILNIIFLAIGAVLVWRFVKTGGPDMLKQMNRPISHHISEKHPEAV